MSIHMPIALPADAAMPVVQPDLSVRRMRLAIGGIWAGVALLLLIVCRSHIAKLTMWDPDDYMRLAQVRDWIGGQSFFDVDQHRFDPRHIFSMHWSRIVDAPIATLSLLFGERFAITAVPLLTLGGIMGGIAIATTRLASRRAGTIAAAVAATTPLILFYVLPLRIDHHGWQVMMAAFTLAACFDSDPRRGGMLAGFGAATWLAVSMEGLPLVTAIALMQGMRFAIEGRAFGADIRFRCFAIALGIASPAWLILLRGPHAFSASYGDMLSPAWLGPLMLAPLAAALAMPLVADRGIVARLGLLIAAAAIGVVALLRIDANVLSGPFKALDPMVRSYWYDNVAEGLPIWRQTGDTVMMLAMFPVVGIAGTIAAWRGTQDEARRRNWMAMLFLALAAFAVSIFVQRAGAVSHLYMVPGAAFLLASILGKVGTWTRPLPRVFASVGAVLLCSPLMTASAGMAALAIVRPEPSTPPGNVEPACAAPCDAFGALNRLPSSHIFASLDVGPRMLVNTHHSFLASGYHRNVAAIHDVIGGFTGPAEAARRIMIAQDMDYVLIDPTGNEAIIYSQHAPKGLMADLLHGRVPDWLEPVALPHSPYRMWRRVR